MRSVRAAVALAAVAATAAGALLTPSLVPTLSLPCGADLTAVYQSGPSPVVYELGGCAYPAADLQGGDGVTLQGQAGTKIADLSVHGAKHLTLRDLTVTDSVTLKPRDGTSGQVSDGVTVTNVTTGLFYSRNTANLTVTGGQWGPSKGISPTIGSYTTAPVSTNVVIDGVHVTGISRDPSQHVEGIFVQDVTHFRLVNSRFDNNAVYDFSIGGLNAATSDYYVANTFFGATTDGFYAGQVTDANTGQASTGRFENNTFEQGIYNPSSPVSGCGNVKAGSFNSWPTNFDKPCGTPPPPTTTTTVTTVPVPPPCALEQTYRTGLVDLRAATLYTQYKKANPKEAARVDAWLTSPKGVKPAVSTATGRFLVGDGTLYAIGC